MAVVTDRGQQLLIGGLVLALFLTALVIVLNGALYTDDLQTRGAAGQTLAADDYEGELSRELGRTLDAINDRRKSDRTALEDAVLDATFVTNDLFGRQYAGGQAAYATVDSVRLEDGIIIQQDSDCTFLALHSNCPSTSTSTRPVHPSFTYDDNGDGNDWIVAGNQLPLDASKTTDYDSTSDDLSYDWEVTEGANSITADNAGPTPSITPDESGFWNVTLTVRDSNGPTRTVSAWVAVYDSSSSGPPPHARFAHAPTVAIVDEVVEFNATATTDGDSNITSYDWSIKAPDGSTASRSGETPTFTPTATGDYTVTLDVSDATGNVDTLRKTVTVEETLADGGGRTGDSDDDGTPEPPFRVGPVPRDGYLALGESGAAPDSPDWTLAESATVRQFEIETTDMDTLASVDDADSDDATAIENADTFYVELTGSDGKSWELHIFESAPSGQFTVATIAPDGTVDIHARSNTGLSVDVTTGEVNGRQVFPFAPGLSRPYDIAFRNGDRISGSYELTLATGASASTDVQTANVYPPTGDREPYAGPAVYAVNVPVTYDTSELSRRATVRVAPDEPTAHGRSVSLDVPRPSYTDRDAIVYTSPDTGRLYSRTPDGARTDYGVTGVQAIGPKQVDLDADGVAEIPYVADNGSLMVIDANGEGELLVDTGATEAPISPDNPDSNFDSTLLATGEWKGKFAVFYAGTGQESGDPQIYQVSTDAGPSVVPETDVANAGGGKSVAGIDDFNADGDGDLVYIGDSQQVWWIDDGARQPQSSQQSINSVSGIGQPRRIDVNGDGDRIDSGDHRLPFTAGSGYIDLRDANENLVTPSTDVAPNEYSPVTIFDWNGDGRRDVIYVNSNDDTLYYVTLSGDIRRILFGDEPVSVDPRTGVA